MKNLMTSTLLFLLTLSMPMASVCQTNEVAIACDYQAYEIEGLYGNRKVLVSLPESAPPQDGYPVVLFFQGSFFPINFTRNFKDPFGGINEVLVIKEFLENGYMVVAPVAGASLFWQTNLIGLNYEISADKFFIDSLLSNINDGQYGPADMTNLFATGISSGGYMTDRMAWSHRDYPFRALAIASASFAKCGGINCKMPEAINQNHPPTLFLHGAKDVVVPAYTMKKYNRLLKKNGVITHSFINKDASHEWLVSSPKLILNWFNKFLRRR